MGLSEKDIKLLWSRSAGRCSFLGCGMKLSQDKALSSASYPVGEQAHIVGEKEDSPRGRSNLSPDERNSYYNRILLCPTHHIIVDKDVEYFSIERLHQIKDQHELWVDMNFSTKQDKKEMANYMVYADLIDSAVSNCRFEEWERWASAACSTTMTWDLDAHEKTMDFYKKVVCTVWPNAIPELECAIRRLASSMMGGVETFYEHCEEKRGKVREQRFYHIDEWNEKLYNELLEEYNTWKTKCEEYVYDATKAANWIAEIVRREINPAFFVTAGKFHVIQGPHDNFGFTIDILEYTPEEKQHHLQECNHL
jgi:hypothetical protein